MDFLDKLAYTNPKLYNELIYELYLHIKFIYGQVPLSIYGQE